MILQEHSLASNLVSLRFCHGRFCFSMACTRGANSAYHHTVLVELNNTLVYNDDHVLTQILRGPLLLLSDLPVRHWKAYTKGPKPVLVAYL